ncbi:uncharacterized protein LOC120334447 [Styela clava]
MEQLSTESQHNMCTAGNLDAFFNNVIELTSHLNASSNEAITNNTALLNIVEKRWRLKHILKQLMSYHEFLNKLKKGQNDWMTQKTIGELTNEMVDEYTKEKTKYNQLNQSVAKLSDLLDEAEKICELKSSVDFEFEEINKKNEQLEELKKQFDEKCEIFKGKCITDTEAATLIAKQKQNIVEKLALIEILKLEKRIEKNKVEDRSQKVLMDLEKFFKNIEPEQKPKDLLSLSLALSEELSGVTVKSETADYCSLQISYGSPENKSNVSVDLHLAKQKPPHPTKLLDVKVGDCCVSTDDIISRAVAGNNFAEMIPELQMRFEKNSSLSDEIEKLRKTSAIDWLPSENTLLVIVGSRTCTLHVPEGYPNTGSIQLKDVQGIQNSTVSHMKPSGVEPTLTDWVSFLEHEFD